jgi:hypothetical protein
VLQWHPHIDQQLQDLEDKLRTLGHPQQAEECEALRCAQLAEQEKAHRLMEERLRTVSEETGLSAYDVTDDESADVPGSPSTADQLPAALCNMWDASLLHQLAVDPNFKLSTEENPEDEGDEVHAKMTLEQRIAQQTKRAVFDQMRHELSHPADGMATVTAGLRQLVEDLQACTLPRQERLREQLQQQFDVQLMVQEVSRRECMQTRLISRYSLNMAPWTCKVLFVCYNTTFHSSVLRFATLRSLSSEAVTVLWTCFKLRSS